MKTKKNTNKSQYLLIFSCFFVVGFVNLLNLVKSSNQSEQTFEQQSDYRGTFLQRIVYIACVFGPFHVF